MDDTGRDRHEALVRVRPSQKGDSEEEYRTGKEKKKKNTFNIRHDFYLYLEE